MRVLALAHAWIPHQNAGAEVMVHAMLRALVKRGHDVTVMVSRQPGEPYDLDGVRVVAERGRPDAVRAVLDSQVVITHLENTPRAAMLGRLNGRPVVQVLHNTMRITLDWLVREPPALAVCNSQWMRAYVEAWLSTLDRDMPLMVVRPPVCLADYATTPGDRVTLVNLRRMQTEPGGQRMGKGSEVFWALAERMPDVKFLGVRGAYGHQDIRALSNVDVIDQVPSDLMRDEVYSRTRVLLMPSSYESWGRAGVEAMCSGIPVIAHPTPGLLESLGRAGTFVDRDDLPGWEQALRELLEPRRWAFASERARGRALQLEPTEDLNRWCDAVEALAREP